MGPNYGLIARSLSLHTLHLQIPAHTWLDREALRKGHQWLIYKTINKDKGVVGKTESTVVEVIYDHNISRRPVHGCMSSSACTYLQCTTHFCSGTWQPAEEPRAPLMHRACVDIFVAVHFYKKHLIEDI